MAMSEAGVKLVAEGVDAYVNAMNKADNATGDFAKNTKNSEGSFTGWSSIVRGAFEKVGGIVTEQLANAGKALISFGVDSVKLAGEFEGNMNQFAAAASLPADEIKNFEQLFIDLGKELPVSTMETVQAATALVKGGIDPTVVAAGGLRDTLNFAAAAGLGLEESADIVAKQLGQFVPVAASAAEKTNFMATSMDLMTKVANSSTVDVAELAAGMAQAGGVANAIGLDYEDFAVTMGAISPAFSSAQEAGTSLKNFLTRLQPASKPAFDAMHELGLVTGDTSAMMEFLAQNGIKPVSTEVGALDQQIREYLKTEKGLSSSEVENAMKNMTQNAFFANGELLSMQEIVGVLETATKDLTDEQKINYLQTIFGADAMNTVVSLAGMGVEGFDAFAASVGKANGVTEQAEAVNKGFDFQMQQLQGSLEAFQLIIGGPMRDALAPYIGLMSEAVGVASTMFEIFTDKPPEISSQDDPMTQMAKNMEYAAKQKERFESLPEPMQAVVLAVQGMLDKQDEFIKEFEAVISTSLSLLQPLFDLISVGLSATGRILISTGQMLTDFFTGDSFQMIVESSGTLLNAVTEIFGNLIVVIEPIIQRAIEIIGIMLDSLGPIVSAIVDTFASPAVVGAINQIVNLLGAVVSFGLEFVLATWNELVNSFNTLWPVIDWIIQFIAKRIEIAIPVITAVIEGLTNLLKGDTQDAFKNLWPVVVTAWENIVSTVKSEISDVTTVISGFIDGIKTKFDEMVTAALDFGKDIVQGLIDGINSKIADVLAAATNLIDELKKKFTIKFDFGSPSKVMEKMGGWVGEGLAIGMDKSTKDVLQAATNMVYAAQAPMMAATGGSSVTNVTNNYTLGVSTTASPTAIMRSYDLMRGSI